MKKKLSIITSIVLVFALLMGTFSMSVSAKSSVDKTLKFGSDGKFTILQFADIQDGPILKPITRDLIKEALKRVQPDLVVLTGDNISGGSCHWGLKPVEKLTVASAIDDFMSIFEKAGVPTAMVFGNHDGECFISKEEQMAIYNKYSCSLGVDEGDSIYGCGTYNLPILSSDGRRTAYNLWMIDSGMYEYAENGDKLGYDYVHQDQLDWYVKTGNELKAANGGKAVPSMVFQHIVVPEIWDALMEVPAGTEGAIDANGKYYKLNPENSTEGSVLHEAPCPPVTNGGQFECMKEQGDVVAMFFGHDHVNNYTINYQGIDLVCTAGAGFSSYGDDGRGVRVIELDENDLSTYTTRSDTFLDYFGDQPDQLLRYNAQKNKQHTTSEQAKYTALYVLLFPLISIYRLYKNIFVK